MTRAQRITFWLVTAAAVVIVALLAACRSPHAPACTWGPAAAVYDERPRDTLVVWACWATRE